MTLTRPLLAFALLAFATPCLAQDLELRCEVYNFSDRSQIFVKGKALDSAEVRKKGLLRYEASLRFLPGQRASLSSGRRIAFRTQTVNQGVTQTNVEFLEVRDALDVEARSGEAGRPGVLDLRLSLQDVVQGQEAAGLPVVQDRQVRTRVALEVGREAMVVQGGQTASGGTVQVVIWRVVKPQPRPSKQAPPAPQRR